MGCCFGASRVQAIKDDGEENVSDDFDGPLKNRSCTDVFCLVFFIAFLGGMGYVGFLAYSTGNPNKLVYGVDSWGNTCNQPNRPIPNVSLSGRDMTGKPKSFFFDYIAHMNPYQHTVVLCITKCPTNTTFTLQQMKDLATKDNIHLCRYDVPSQSYVNGSVSGQNKCPSLPVFPQFDIFNRCIPETAINIAQSLLQSALQTFSNLLSTIQAKCSEIGGFQEKAMSDLRETWREILYLSAISFGISLVLLVLMRFFAALVIYTLVLGSAVGSVAGLIFCWYTYSQYKTELDQIHVSKQSERGKQLVQQWLIYACIATATTVIILLVLLVMRKRIKLVVQLFREASKAITKMPLLLLQPLWTLIFVAGFLSSLIYLFLYVETAGHPHILDTGFVIFKPDTVLTYMKWYYILGVLWVVQFVLACHQVVVAGAVAGWYFTRDKTQLGWPILTSTGRLIRYHLGSVAFGSFLIALIQLARMLLAYVQGKLKGRAGKCVDFMLKCLQCCLWCFEKFMKFINRNAYIMMAIYGYNFCKSAQRAFSLLLSNVVRVAAINSVGVFCLFLGKVGVVAVVAVVGLEMLKGKELCYIWVPVLLACLVAFVIANAFLSVYGMAIDTIFLCFCEDCERNDGIYKPYYMTKGLMEFVENSNEALETLKSGKPKKSKPPG